MASDPAVPHQVVMLVDHRRAADVAREGGACFVLPVTPEPWISTERGLSAAPDAPGRLTGRPGEQFAEFDVVRQDGAEGIVTLTRAGPGCGA